jgi:hypothetical protein
MPNDCNKMSSALRTVVVPQLREDGFTGAFPHFRRHRAGRLDLVSFQFDRQGGGFVIEIGQCPSEGFTTHWGRNILAGEITVWDLPPKRRARIKPRPGAGTDSWFRFDTSAVNFDSIAKSVLPFLEPVERMFEEFDQIRKLGD